MHIVSYNNLVIYLLFKINEQSVGLRQIATSIMINIIGEHIMST